MTAGIINNKGTRFRLQNLLGVVIAVLVAGGMLAEKLKMRVKGLSEKTKLYFFSNAFIREFIGLLWEKKWKHLLFIFLFFAVLLVLYLVIRY